MTYPNAKLYPIPELGGETGRAFTRAVSGFASDSSARAQRRSGDAALRRRDHSGFANRAHARRHRAGDPGAARTAIPPGGLGRDHGVRRGTRSHCGADANRRLDLGVGAAQSARVDAASREIRRLSLAERVAKNVVERCEQWIGGRSAR